MYFLGQIYSVFLHGEVSTYTNTFPPDPQLWSRTCDLRQQGVGLGLFE